MTALTFLIVLIAAGVHFATRGYFVFPGLTIYVMAYVATLTTACVASLVSRDLRCILGAVVLVGYFFAHHAAWASPDPVLWLSIASLAVAAYFLIFGYSRWEFIVGLLFAVSPQLGGLTYFGLIPNSAARPDVYIAWSYPDIISILGHMASITLGLGAGDAGLRVRDHFRSRSLALHYRSELVARLVRMAKVQSEAED